MWQRLAGVLVALVLATALARADCGLPPASDAALLAAPDAAAAVATARATMPNAEGRLWTVGTNPPSFLVGTFHVAAGGNERPGPTLETLIDEAGILFVEIEGAALEALFAEWASDPARLFRSGGARLSATMTDAERAAAEAVLAPYGVPFEAADRMQPFVLFGLLSLPPCARAASGGDGLDRVLERRAASAGVEVRALETVEEQLAVLGAEDSGEVDGLLAILLAQAGSLETHWFLNLAFYRHGKIGALWTFGVDGFTRLVGEAEAERIAAAFRERLFGSRNRRMVARMLPRLREGGVVAAVGALHLPGEDGIVELLRAEGFAVTPVDEEPVEAPPVAPREAEDVGAGAEPPGAGGRLGAN